MTDTKLQFSGPVPVFEAADNHIVRTPYGHLTNAWRYRAFFIYWVRRSLVTRYRRTSLGWIWAILQPLLSSLIFIFVFSVILKVDTKDVPYGLFIITGLVFWNYFSRIILIGANTVTSNADLLSRIQFPREFLPLAVWVEALVDMLISFLIILGAFIFYKQPVSPYWPIAFIAIGIETMLALGLTFLFAGMTVYIRDLLQVVPLLMQLLVYLAPIIYPLSQVPANFRSLFMLNPLVPIFATLQETILYGKFTLQYELLYAGIVSFILMIVGYMIFKRVEWHFVDSN